MAPVIPDKKKIKSFRTEAAFERWLAAHHARETELWLRIYKKDSGMADGHRRTGAGCGAVLGLDRRSSQVL